MLHPRERLWMLWPWSSLSDAILLKLQRVDQVDDARCCGSMLQGDELLFFSVSDFPSKNQTRRI